MASLNNFGYAEGVAAQVTVPVTTITATVTENDGVTLIADYTGEHAILFPAVLAALSSEQRVTLMDLIAQQIVLLRAGVI